MNIKKLADSVLNFTIKRLIEIIDRLLNRPKGTSKSLVNFAADRLGHDYRYAIDASKIKRKLGWEPKTSFELGLEETVKDYLKNNNI